MAYAYSYTFGFHRLEEKGVVVPKRGGANLVRFTSERPQITVQPLFLTSKCQTCLHLSAIISAFRH